MADYFSDREQGSRPRIEEVVSPTVWGGIVGLVQSLIATGAFGAKYPEPCPDGQGPIGTDENALMLAVQAEMPGLAWPLVTTERIQEDYFSKEQPFAPDTLLVLDFIEFCHRVVAKPIEGSFHTFFGHHHLSFDEAEGQQVFREDINRIFSRNNLAYELRPDGQVVRLAPAVLSESLSSARFRTSDSILNDMLEESRAKFLNPSQSIRREAVERLWDCWERLKSLDSPGNKKQSIESLLLQAAPDAAFRSVLETEARALTEIGNSFHIRHSEVTQSALTDSAHIDYLFHRLYSLMALLLSKRGGSS
ncbi:AbiJ-NTD4 domain-containing protein [Comamonas kerstersii]|uniref:AbiJ-NTD4 domain-containing protein n=1 Tax=Comamonas kerstersii TaxID=225992 RepID=UPI00098451D2|nr:hypothetical protein [Comamonas kerstersii]OOH88496.1 hypothetical protein BMF38_01050 [Comamonas kerstersii]OOH95696.1 hypothetical protein BMF29_02775 [Comamonas kerstersii]